MTESINIKAVVILCVLFCVCGLVRGDYEITWHSIDAGGNTSTGGPYSLTGTIGQSDTGVSSANQYVLSAGFLPGNFGCVVNLTDLTVFVEHWLDTGDCPADFDGNDRVDFADFATFALWWQEACPGDWPFK